MIKYSIYVKREDLKSKYMLMFIDLMCKFPLIDWSYGKSSLRSILEIDYNPSSNFLKFLRDKEFIEDDGMHNFFVTLKPFDPATEHDFSIAFKKEDLSFIDQNKELKVEYGLSTIATNIRSHQRRVFDQIQELQGE